MDYQGNIIISGIPIKGIDAASSRIRFFRMFENLPDNFVYKESCIECDIFYVQKVAYPKTIELVKQLKSKGVFIVYDIDDAVGVFPQNKEFDMLKIADIITTDTTDRAEYLITYKNTSVCNSRCFGLC